MTDPVEASGHTVVEAIDAALEMLGASEDEVDVQILAESPEGVATQANAARVRVRLRDERSEEDRAMERQIAADKAETSQRVASGIAAEHAEDAKEFLEGLFEVMDVEATIEAHTGPFGAEIEVHGGDLAALIGRHGHTLAAVQELTRAAVQRDRDERATVSVDIEGYLRRRIEMLERQARTAAARVRKSGRSFSFEAMPARDRKIIHDALTGFPGVQTTSEGTEPQRFVVVLPR